MIVLFPWKHDICINVGIIYTIIKPQTAPEKLIISSGFTYGTKTGKNENN